MHPAIRPDALTGCFCNPKIILNHHQLGGFPDARTIFLGYHTPPQVNADRADRLSRYVDAALSDAGVHPGGSASDIWAAGRVGTRGVLRHGAPFWVVVLGWSQEEDQHPFDPQEKIPGGCR